MKRDPRLRALSAEHHHALVLARRLATGPADGAVVRELRRRHDDELSPHFEAEETLLLPALRAAGHGALADRTAQEHAELRALLAAAEAAPAEAASPIAAFAALLVAHVRFEERTLFPTAEACLPAAVLDRLTA